MPFARVGNLITQTGTDTNLSGLTGSINNNVTTFTAGQKTFYVLPPETRLLVQGTLGIFAVDEAVVTDNDDSVNSGAGDASQAGITIDTTGVLNIEGRIHPTISNASQVLTDVAGASNSLQIAHYFSGSQRPWHGFVTNGPDAGAIGIQTGGTINARGVTLSKGRGGFAPYIGTLGRLQDCIIDTEDRSNPENQGSNSLNGSGRELRGNLSRIRTTQMDIIDCTIIGGSWIIQEQRVEGTNLSTFSGLTFATHDKVTTDPGLWLNTSANPQVVDNPSFVGKGTDLSIQSNDVSLSPLYTQNLPTQVYVQNAERGTETIARPVDNNNSSWGYCNFGKHVSVSANVLNGTPADTDQAVFYCEDQPSDFATRNQKTVGTFSTGVFNPTTNNASITGQAENTQITYFNLLNNTGNLNNTASFGTPANTARITIGILDMPQNENAGNAYDTGNTRIDRRGNAVDNTSTSAEKLQDNFTFYFYRRDYQIIETTQSLKGNGVQEFTPIFLPDTNYRDTDFNNKTTALTTQEAYDYEKTRKGVSQDAFVLPTVSGLYASVTGTSLDYGSRALFFATAGSEPVSPGDTSIAINTGGPAFLPTEDLNSLITTGVINVSNLGINQFTSISAGSFAGTIPVLTSTGLTISSTDTGAATTGPSTQTFNYDGNFRLSPQPPSEVGHIASLGTYMVVAFVDADGVDREDFWTQLQVGDSITANTTPTRTITAIGTTFDGTEAGAVPGISFTMNNALNNFGITGGTGFSITVQAASIDTPGMRPTNSIPTGGNYGATFGEGIWQLADAQSYTFENGAFTATDTTLLGPTTGTAVINLATGQTLMDIAGVASIDNIDARAPQAQPSTVTVQLSALPDGTFYTVHQGGNILVPHAQKTSTTPNVVYSVSNLPGATDTVAVAAAGTPNGDLLLQPITLVYGIATTQTNHTKQIAVANTSATAIENVNLSPAGLINLPDAPSGAAIAGLTATVGGSLVGTPSDRIEVTLNGATGNSATTFRSSRDIALTIGNTRTSAEYYNRIIEQIDIDDTLDTVTGNVGTYQYDPFVPFGNSVRWRDGRFFGRDDDNSIQILDGCVVCNDAQTFSIDGRSESQLRILDDQAVQTIPTTREPQWIFQGIRSAPSIQEIEAVAGGGLTDAQATQLTNIEGNANLIPGVPGL